MSININERFKENERILSYQFEQVERFVALTTINCLTDQNDFLFIVDETFQTNTIQLKYF